VLGTIAIIAVVSHLHSWKIWLEKGGKLKEWRWKCVAAESWNDDKKKLFRRQFAP